MSEQAEKAPETKMPTLAALAILTPVQRQWALAGAHPPWVAYPRTAEGPEATWRGLENALHLLWWAAICGLPRAVLWGAVIGCARATLKATEKNDSWKRTHAFFDALLAEAMTPGLENGGNLARAYESWQVKRHDMAMADVLVAKSVHKCGARLYQAAMTADQDRADTLLLEALAPLLHPYDDRNWAMKHFAETIREEISWEEWGSTITAAVERVSKLVDAAAVTNTLQVLQPTVDAPVRP